MHKIVREQGKFLKPEEIKIIEGNINKLIEERKDIIYTLREYSEENRHLKEEIRKEKAKVKFLMSPNIWTYTDDRVQEIIRDIDNGKGTFQ
jgi:lipid A disaccharide synthetase